MVMHRSAAPVVTLAGDPGIAFSGSQLILCAVTTAILLALVPALFIGALKTPVLRTRIVFTASMVVGALLLAMTGSATGFSLWRRTIWLREGSSLQAQAAGSDASAAMKAWERIDRLHELGQISGSATERLADMAIEARDGRSASRAWPHEAGRFLDRALTRGELTAEQTRETTGRSVALYLRIAPGKNDPNELHLQCVWESRIFHTHHFDLEVEVDDPDGHFGGSFLRLSRINRGRPHGWSLWCEVPDDLIGQEVELDFTVRIVDPATRELLAPAWAERLRLKMESGTAMLRRPPPLVWDLPLDRHTVR